MLHSATGPDGCGGPDFPEVSELPSQARQIRMKVNFVSFDWLRSRLEHNMMSEKKLMAQTSAWAENDPEGLLDFASSSKCVATSVKSISSKLSRYQSSAGVRESMSERRRGDLGAGTEPVGNDMA